VGVPSRSKAPVEHRSAPDRSMPLAQVRWQVRVLSPVASDAVIHDITMDACLLSGACDPELLSQVSDGSPILVEVSLPGGVRLPLPGRIARSFVAPTGAFEIALVFEGHTPSMALPLAREVSRHLSPQDTRVGLVTEETGPELYRV
jgi:hypothetical protein